MSKHTSRFQRWEICLISIVVLKNYLSLSYLQNRQTYLTPSFNVGCYWNNTVRHWWDIKYFSNSCFKDLVAFPQTNHLEPNCTRGELRKQIKVHLLDKASTSLQMPRSLPVFTFCIMQSATRISRKMLCNPEFVTIFEYALVIGHH